jgi:hypothetical protein
MSAVPERLDDKPSFDIVATVRSFEALEFDPGKFDHEAHVRIAWCYLQQYPPALAIARFTVALRTLTQRIGMPQKYHETLSWFFMIVIADRCARSPTKGWDRFRADNSDLFNDATLLLKQHYSAACLGSTRARERFVLPDLAPSGMRGTISPEQSPGNNA